MRWADVVMQLDPFDHKRIAMVMAAGWSIAVEVANEATLQNVTMNSNTPLGIAYALDNGGIPVPESLIHALE